MSTRYSVERPPRTEEPRERQRFEQSVYDVLTKGAAPPSVTTAQRNALTPFPGMLIFNSTTGKLNIFTTGWEVVTSA
jgi:hypothetical protein